MLCVGYTDENRGATLFRHLEENRRYTIPILIDQTLMSDFRASWLNSRSARNSHHWQT